MLIEGSGIRVRLLIHQRSQGGNGSACSNSTYERFKLEVHDHITVMMLQEALNVTVELPRGIWPLCGDTDGKGYA